MHTASQLNLVYGMKSRKEIMKRIKNIKLSCSKETVLSIVCGDSKYRMGQKTIRGYSSGKGKLGILHCSSWTVMNAVRTSAPSLTKLLTFVKIFRYPSNTIYWFHSRLEE